MSKELEEWKTVEGFPSYSVSNLGRVKSNLCSKEKILKQNVTPQGYAKVTLSDGLGYGLGSTRKTVFVHQLVAKAFVENPNNYEVIDHINANRQDNRAVNLRWTDSKKNITENPVTMAKKKLAAQKSAIERSQMVYVYNEDLELVTAFTSTADAGRSGYSQGNVTNCCNGILKRYKGLIFSYQPIQSIDDRKALEDSANEKRNKVRQQVYKAMSKWYFSDNSKGREKAREYYHKNREKRLKQMRDNYYRKKYGKTKEIQD